jgi:hypothetical protein
MVKITKGEANTLTSTYSLSKETRNNARILRCGAKCRKRLRKAASVNMNERK